MGFGLFFLIILLGNQLGLYTPELIIGPTENAISETRISIPPSTSFQPNDLPVSEPSFSVCIPETSEIGSGSEEHLHDASTELADRKDKIQIVVEHAGEISSNEIGPDSSTRIEAENNGKRQCAICLEYNPSLPSVHYLPEESIIYSILATNHQGKPIYVKCCRQLFHEACFKKWFELKGTCPVCRKTLPSSTPTLGEVLNTQVIRHPPTQQGLTASTRQERVHPRLIEQQFWANVARNICALFTGVFIFFVSFKTIIDLISSGHV